MLFTLVLLAPLPLGGNREWAWTLNALLIALLAVAWCVHTALAPGERLRPLPATPVIMFLAVCGWIWVQTSAAAPAGWQHPLWAMTGEALGTGLPGRITVAREDSLVALQGLVTYGLVFLLAFQLCRDRERAAAAHQLLTFAGLAYALYGLTVYWGELGTLLWFKDEAYNADVRGTFVNRNSFATYLGLCLLVSLSGLYRKLALPHNRAYTLPGQRQWRTEKFLVQGWIPLAILLVMISALILTHSRAGFGSFVAGALALVCAVHYRRRIGGTRSLAAIAAASLVGLSAFVLTGEVLVKRMDRMNMDWPGRLETYAATTTAIGDNPVLGFGYGTFADSFRPYRNDSLKAHLDMAHNTYLENVFELGWPAAALLFLCIAWLGGMCLAGLRDRGRDWIYPATGLAATVLVSVHSLFDFSLQMPAIAITYACIMGIGCAQSLPSGSRAPDRPPPGSRG